MMHLPKLSSRKASVGFTLIELMVALAIAAVLLMVAAPSFVGFQRNSEMTSAANALLAAANTARAEAMKTGLRAMVIPAGNSNSWSDGWIVFVDKNRDNSFTATADTTVLVQPALPAFITVSATGNAAASPAYIMFDSSGYAKSSGSSVPNLTLSLVRNDVPTGQAASETRRVVVSRSGRVRTCRPSTDTTCTSSAAS